MSFLESLTGYNGRLMIGTVQVDASISENHVLEADVTDHAVEEGSDISDHYRARNRSVQIEGIITDTPLETTFPGQTAFKAVDDLIRGNLPVKSGWETFKRYFDEAEIIVISTSLDQYEDVVLSNFSATRNAKSGNALRFSCTARQMKIVSTEEAVAIKIPKVVEKAKEKEKKSQGKKQPKKANKNQGDSALKKIKDKVVGFFK